jgi:hypothetical protein
MKYLCFVLAFLAISCSHPSLHIRSEYFSKKDLASFAVDTPDPLKDTNYFGQRLTISWNVPSALLKTAPVEVRLIVRLANGEERTCHIPIEKSFGFTLYPIVGDDYTKKGGLQSYYAELKADGKPIAKSRHKFWVEKIKPQN